MKVQILHVPTSKKFVTDRFNDLTLEEIYNIVNNATCGKSSNVRFLIEGNHTFFPEKILAESVITIIKD